MVQVLTESRSGKSERRLINVRTKPAL